MRRRQYERTRDQLRRSTFAPFSVDGWLSSPPDGLQPDPCIIWPTPEPGTQPAVPPRTRFPDIPALVLSGDLDLNVTTAEARDVAALFPKSRFVELTNSGHHTVFSWRSECSAQIIQTFLATLKPGDTSCARDLNVVFPAVGRFPAAAATPVRLSRDSSGDHSTKTDRKVAAVVAATFTDSLRRAYMTGEDGPGLRGGTFDVEFTDTETNLDLAAARYAGDVTVTGHGSVPFETNAIDAQLTVDGPGCRGRQPAPHGRMAEPRRDDAAHPRDARRPRGLPVRSRDVGGERDDQHHTHIPARGPCLRGRSRKRLRVGLVEL